MDLIPGTRVLERYVVESLLGEGGMGKVFLGQHVMLGVQVALKVLTVEPSPEMLGRFQREARMMAQIRHPNVVAVLDYGLLEDGAPCIAMEFVQGEALDKRLDRRGALPWTEAAELILGVLAGLDAVHNIAVVHRDLKPSNVILAPGNPEVPKLIDFGIAKPTDSSSAKFTRTGQMVGTPAYMAPEQFLDLPVDARTDVYTTGLILYELVAGELPFAAAGMGAVLKRLQGTPPPPVAPASQPPIPKALQDLLAAVLQADMGERIGSAREFAAALQAVRYATDAPPAAFPGLRPTAPSAPPQAAPPYAATPQAAPPQAAPPRTDDAAFYATAIGERPGAEAGKSRFLFAARLPPSRLTDPQERKWLAEVARSYGRGFTLGAQFWFTLQGTLGSAEAATEGARALAAAFQERYGALARVEWGLVDEGFAITAASLSGANRLPPALNDLLTRLK